MLFCIVLYDNITLSVQSGAEVVEEGEYKGMSKLDAALDVVGGEEWRKRGLILGEHQRYTAEQLRAGQCAFWVEISEVQKHVNRRSLRW